jgi:hypothetical protein
MTPEMALLEEFIRAAAIILSVLIIGGTVVATVGLWKAPETISKIALALIRSHGVTQTIISMIIIGAIIALRLLDKISAEATIGVLGAIMGYVLRDAANRLTEVARPFVGRADDSPP